MKQFVAIAIALAALIGQASAQDKIVSGPSMALTTDPLVQIYRFTGVRDNGGAAGLGVATTFHCSNFSGADENIRIQIRQYNGAVLTDHTYSISHNRTRTISTHDTNAYAEDFVELTGLTQEGLARIWATSTSVICNAKTVAADAPFPLGVTLTGVRFNPIPNTEE
jgi:opacity protein-like surface antigen